MFTEEAGAIRLHASRCPACGRHAFPPRSVCGVCGNRAQQATRLSGRGSVLSSTRVATPPDGFDQPYLFAVIDLEEDPRVFGLLTGEAEAGRRVRAVPARVKYSQAGFAFEPIP